MSSTLFILWRAVQTKHKQTSATAVVFRHMLITLSNNEHEPLHFQSSLFQLPETLFACGPYTVRVDTTSTTEVKMYTTLIYIYPFLFAQFIRFFTYFSYESWEAMSFPLPFQNASHFSLSVNSPLCLFKWIVFRGDTGLHPENDGWHFTDIH